MDAKPRNLKDIFDTQCRYLVPLYQRPYVWRKKEQWVPLWDDIQALAERYMRRDTRPNFMGAVVLEQLNFATGTIDLRQVIDGQQRLTTLQIIIEAAGDICASLGEQAADHFSALRQLTRNTLHSQNPDEAYKVWPTNSDRDDFRRVMSAGSPAEVGDKDGSEPDDDDDDLGVANSYLFFHARIIAWLLGPDSPGTLPERLDGLQNAIYKGFIIVVIDLDDKDDAQVIFETLNARGTPLLASDLVKNYLLHRAEATDPKAADALYERHWKPFDERRFWRKEVRQGRLNRPRIELYLQHYLTLKTQKEVLATSLFHAFREYVKARSALTIADHLAALHHYGDIFHDFYRYPGEAREGLFFRRIEALDTTTVFPLLLHIFDKLGRPKHDEERRAILTDLESFLVRRLFCELTTKNYNNLFLEAGKAMADVEPTQLRDVLAKFLMAKSSDIDRWPNDDDFWQGWNKLEAYRRIKPQGRLRMVLEALELHLRQSELSEEQTLPKKKLSIEHILPRGWKANWPLPEETDEAKDRRELLLHTLGNLTLVTKKLNSTLSNNAWSEKRKTLRRSILNLNADLIVREEWNEAEIRRRSKELFKLVKEIWPFPG
jgi:hypothetical protein